MNNNKTKEVFNKNHEKIRDFFLKYPTQIFSISDLQNNLQIPPVTIKKPLIALLKENFVNEVMLRKYATCQDIKFEREIIFFVLNSQDLILRRKNLREKWNS